MYQNNNSANSSHCIRNSLSLSPQSNRPIWPLWLSCWLHFNFLQIKPKTNDTFFFSRQSLPSPRNMQHKWNFVENLFGYLYVSEWHYGTEVASWSSAQTTLRYTGVNAECLKINAAKNCSEVLFLWQHLREPCRIDLCVTIITTTKLLSKYLGGYGKIVRFLWMLLLLLPFDFFRKQMYHKGSYGIPYESKDIFSFFSDIGHSGTKHVLITIILKIHYASVKLYIWGA